MNGIIRRFVTTALNFQRFNNLKIQTTPSLAATTFHKQYSNAPTPYEIVDQDIGKKLDKDVLNKVNSLVKNDEAGRLFAVVHLAGKQFKITSGDIIVVEGYWPPDVGNKITLDKVLLAGGRDFSLIGRPFVQTGLIRVEATVIEKTLSHTKTHFRKKRRKQYMRINFYRIPQTYLRINCIDVVGTVGDPPAVRGLEHAVF